MPDYLIPLGRTVGVRRQRRRLQPLGLPRAASSTLRRELRARRLRRRPRPRAARRRWSAGTPRSCASAPVVGTFHAYSTKAVPQPHRERCSAPGACFNQLSARIAVSEAAAWTGRRWFGGEYTIIPNGVDVDAAPERARSRRATSCGSLFVGRAEERKGLPVLLTAFEALVEHVPCPADRGRRRSRGGRPLRRRPRD